ncbi:FixH family protein [Umboniibacter marinipuniceus]|uniref:Nitrogen fixation protein FixH n=1 Tax=Umboniibacter marinipuniceus TaxID=569599 RepID=A0A3M0ACP4_9GAMM|nr:FixH family protein [Umboniibacter marinipuniceus]RMA81399.1 hypothetical protein DFR27_1219 [Umboniibacter marinipuniceus]
MTDSNVNATHEDTRWFKQPWALFVLGILLVDVVFALIFVGRSISGADDVVVSDYYKEGLAINERIAKADEAQALGLEANITFDQLDEVVEVVVDLNLNPEQADTLILRLIHPVSEDLDQQFIVQRVGDSLRFEGLGEGNLIHRWYVQIEPLARSSWLLTGELDLSVRNSVRLEANGN